MKLSYLIKKGVEHLSKHGDCDVRISLLTENQANYLDDKYISTYDYNGIFEIFL